MYRIMKTILIALWVAFFTTTVHAQNTIYKNNELGITYTIPEGFQEEQSSLDHSLIRLRGKDDSKEGEEIKISYLSLGIPSHITSWDKEVLYLVEQISQSEKVQQLFNTVSFAKHSIHTGNKAIRCVRVIREFKVKEMGSAMEYMFIHKGGILSVTIFATCPASQIHKYEKYINNLTVESK